MNPPYQRRTSQQPGTGDFVEHARRIADAGATVVCLLPVRTSTQWWQEHVSRGEIRFAAGRLKFGVASSPAPFESAVVIMRSADRQLRVGQVVNARRRS